MQLIQRKQAGEVISKKILFLKRPPNNHVILQYGPIAGRPPTIFFPYPQFLNTNRMFKPEKMKIVKQEQLLPHSQLTFRISS